MHSLLCLAGLGLCCCDRFSLVAASRGYPPVAEHGLLVAVACSSCLRARALGLAAAVAAALKHRFSSCGIRA